MSGSMSWEQDIQERRSRPDLETGFEKYRTLVDATSALPVMHGVRRVGVNECAGGDELGMLGKSFRRGRRREDVGGNEQSERDTESSAEHSAENEDRDAAPKFVHGSVSCVQGLRGLNSCADHRGDLMLLVWRRWDQRAFSGAGRGPQR